MTTNPSTRQTLRGVALDMDGLLFDTEKLYWQCGDQVLIRRGLRFCADLQQRMMETNRLKLHCIICYMILDLSSPLQLLYLGSHSVRAAEET